MGRPVNRWSLEEMEITHFWASNTQQCLYTTMLFRLHVWQFEISWTSVFLWHFRKAYAASTFVRSIYKDGRINVKLVALKMKISLLKKQSIARLGLLGATIFVRLAKTEQNELPRKWKPCSGSTQWLFYVGISNLGNNTSLAECKKFECIQLMNPADIPSHGMSASELVSKKRWWNGPEFLFKDEREWPQEDNIQSDNKNARKEIIQNPATLHMLWSPIHKWCKLAHTK